MDSKAQGIMDKITALVDTYHSQHHELPALIEMRRDLAVQLFYLSSHVKQVYGRKALSYVMRKYAIAREIARAIEDDKAAVKKRPMNQLEAQTEALDHVLQRRKEETEREAEHEALTAAIDSTKQVLAAMQQEIAVLAYEYKNSHFQNQGR